MTVVAQKLSFVAMPPPPGRPVDPHSESARQPWLAEGMSKRTYYRQKAAGTLSVPSLVQHDAHVAAWLSTLTIWVRLDYRVYARRCRMEAERTDTDSGALYGMYVSAVGVS